MTYNNNIDPPVYVLYLQQLTRALAGNSKDSGEGRAIYYIIILYSRNARFARIPLVGLSHNIVI